jgi:putative transposase
MTSYRRNFVAGGSYFFTGNLADRRLQLLTQHIERLRAAFRYTQERHPFTVEAAVILPDHLHAVWTLPDGDADFATRWRLIKTEFSRALPPDERISGSRHSKGERGIWQRRYWEHTLRNEGDFERHVNYIHFNPVKHGHVSRVKDWPYSSFHRMVQAGVTRRIGRVMPQRRGAISGRDDGYRAQERALHPSYEKMRKNRVAAKS